RKVEPKTTDDDEEDLFDDNDDPFIDEDAVMEDANDDNKVMEDPVNEDEAQEDDNNDNHSNGRIPITQDNGLQFQPIFKKLCRETDIKNEEAKKLAAIIVANANVTMEQVMAVNVKLLVTTAH
ncbi:hypothetical protein FQN50_009989, partial [Emmonsiellopsis sp. PD_5]